MTAGETQVSTRPDGGAGVGVAVVTISNERSLEDDPAGNVIGEAFEAAGHAVATRERIRKDHDNVQSIATRLVDRDDVDIVVTAGGAGIEPDDATIEAIRPLLDKELPAFDEYFHRLSFDEIGSSGICRRTLGGITDGVPIFCLPGVDEAARLGAERIVVPEAARLVDLANGDEGDEGETETVH